MYTQSKLLIYFFTYCIVGWIWESCYVSVQKRKWVNRGFLYGPWLPIYGCGAMLILLGTGWCKDSPVLIFLFGTLAATLLEYLTGALMEKIFHVRYWDYSNKPLNLKGHICLSSSVAWGLFSLLLLKTVHPFVQKILLPIPESVLQPVGLILTVLFVIDVTRSIQDALDIKAFLKKMHKNSDALAHIKEILQRAPICHPEPTGQFADPHELLKKQIKKMRSFLLRNPSASSKKHQTALNELIDLKITEFKEKRQKK